MASAHWQRVWGGILALTGFLLSPLSWWNDAFVNLPLAFAFGWGIGKVHPPSYETAVVVGYWITNVLGLLLLHKGVVKVKSGTAEPWTTRQVLKYLLFSLAYTLVIVVLLKFKVLEQFNPSTPTTWNRTPASGPTGFF